MTDLEQYTWQGDTWWAKGDCPECGATTGTNGTVEVCYDCNWKRKLDTDQ